MTRERIDENAVRRITRVYARSTDDARRHGATWYAAATLTAAEIAADNGLSLRQSAGVIAALSPRLTWAENVRGARKIAEAAAAGLDCPAVGLGIGRARAWKIATTDVDPLDVLGGPKVRAFFRNIIGEHDHATVDVWAQRAAGIDGSLTPAKYQRTDHAYRAAARRLGVATAVLQATVWITVRGAAF